MRLLFMRCVVISPVRSRPNSKIHDNLLPACLPAFGKRDDVYVGTQLSQPASSAQRTAGQKVGYN